MEQNQNQVIELGIVMEQPQHKTCSVCLREVENRDVCQDCKITDDRYSYLTTVKSSLRGIIIGSTTGAIMFFSGFDLLGSEVIALLCMGVSLASFID